MQLAVSCITTCTVLAPLKCCLPMRPSDVLLMLLLLRPVLHLVLRASCATGTPCAFLIQCCWVVAFRRTLLKQGWQTAVCVCVFVLGRCTRGAGCRYNHDLPAAPVYVPPSSPPKPRFPAPVASSQTPQPKSSSAAKQPGIPRAKVTNRPCCRFADGLDCDAS